MKEFILALIFFILIGFAFFLGYNWNPKLQLQLIAENLAKEQYYRDEYNCDEFAKELQRRLKDAGYNASYCIGDALWCNATEEEDGNCGHAWVKVDTYIEAVSGIILKPSEFEENYKLDYCQ